MPAIPDQVDQATDTVNFILIDGNPVGLITFADSIRESAAQAIAALKKMNIRSFLLTGDNEKIAEGVGIGHRIKKSNQKHFLHGSGQRLPDGLG